VCVLPIASIFWANNAEQDVHLVPGFVGPRLDQLLWTEQTPPPNVRSDKLAAPVTVAFAANFGPGPGTAGVAFNAANGEVTVTAPLSPSPRLLDFIVTATVTEGGNVFTAHKRFRIHTSIIRIWLTPATLTVRQIARNGRFTVLAEFNDGTYGDISPWSPWDPPLPTDRTYVHRSASNDPAIAWSTAAAGTVGVHDATGLLTGVTVGGNAAISADLRPLPAPANHTAVGTARVAQPWSDPVTLTLIDGPGFAAMPTVSNVLILPDGFPAAPAADRAGFERLARELVQRLRVRQMTRPYDLLKNRMNYFMAWVESREAGISPLEEVRRFNVAGVQADAVEVDTTVAPAAVAGARHVAAPPTPATNDRFLLNERDTGFHVALGERPRAIRSLQIRDATFHPSRFSEEDFDDFLRALRDPGGVAVGTAWARGGRDEQRILVLCRSRRTGGTNSFRQNSGRYICMTLDRELQHRIEDKVGGLGKDLRPDAIPAAVQIEIWTTAAHELAHSFTLADEYGGGGALPASRVADVARRSNIAARATLLTGGNLDANRIRWRWPRIRKAGVLAAVPLAIGGGRFRIRLEVGHGAAFAGGDVVRFRLRPLLSAPAPSDRFIVVAVAADELEVEPLTATPFVPATYPAGNVVISPTRAPDPNPGGRVFGDDLELVHQAVLARINATRNPLNAAHGQPANRPCLGGALPTPTGSDNWPDTDVPPNGRPNPPNPPIYSSWIVGLYENGLSFDCDVYRPTGVCIMRTLHYVDPPAAPERAYQFCPVCRYVMVDAVDPTRHGAIDGDYAKRYPT
jgi:hypothetical protein